MTIALGFRHRSGVILCADTEMTDGIRKLHGSKLSHFDCPIGRVGIVFAGNVNNATTVAQKIRARLKSSGASEPKNTIERIIDSEYRRLVSSFPADQREALDFQFIIAFRPLRGRTRMFVSDGAALWEHERDRGPATAGVGRAFAEQMISAASVGMDTRSNLLVLAAYVLAAVKKQIGHCGGMSLFLDFDDDGTVSAFYGDEYLEAVEKWFGVFHMFAWDLSVAMADVDRTDDDFEANLEAFNERLRRRRSEWMQARETHLKVSEALWVK